MSEKRMTPSEVAELLSVSRQTVVAWITRGELPATNVARTTSSRRLWRVSQSQLAEFERRRSNQRDVPAKKRKPTARHDQDVIQFYAG